MPARISTPSPVPPRLPERTAVVIVGAGPAGLILSRLLALQGIDSVVLDRRSRRYVEARVRAGILEQPTVDLLREIGAAWRLDREAEFHRGFYVRLDGRTHHLDFHALLGRNSCVYGQAELVKDLIHDQLAAHRPLLFEVDDITVSGVDGEGSEPVVEFSHAGARHRLGCAVVAGCDGAHGVGRATLRAVGERLGRPVRLFEKAYPAAWLGILARSTPPSPEGMYCVHPDGMSLHSMRGPRLTRQYLQVEAGAQLADWPDERIWAELRRRSAGTDSAPLESGPIIERTLVPLRATVLECFGIGRLALAGDAAHTVPPTGAKGLNLAVGDVVVLARAVAALLAGDPGPLAEYTGTCRSRVWQGVRFSTDMTTLLHRLSDDPFDWELRRARMRALLTSPDEQRSHGEVYLGLPFATDWRWRRPPDAGTAAAGQMTGATR